MKIAAPLPAAPATVPAAREVALCRRRGHSPSPPHGAARTQHRPTGPRSRRRLPLPAGQRRRSGGTTTPAAAAAIPPAITTPPLAPPDVWTPEELAAGLRQCVQLLAPVAADVAMEQPMKHGQCGTPAPLALRSAGGKDKVEFTPAPTMNCRLAASMGEWVDKVLQPAAQETLGSRITKILGSGSYSCRNIYNNPKLTLSEHATGNAIDVAAFVTADGRTITVKQGLGPDRARHRGRQEKGGREAVGGQETAGKPTAATPRRAVPTPSIAEAAKKAETKQKGRVEKTDFKQDEVISLPWSPAPT